jgi:hypothetical protein
MCACYMRIDEYNKAWLMSSALALASSTQTHMCVTPHLGMCIHTQVMVDVAACVSATSALAPSGRRLQTNFDITATVVGATLSEVEAVFTSNIAIGAILQSGPPTFSLSRTLESP